METTRWTNWLLLGILMVLTAHLGLRFLDGPVAVAETFQLDNCITLSPGEKPEGYVHVVSHGTGKPR
jgi:hypothetical protein